MTLSALNRKLWRDLWRMRGQAFAIAMVVAAGVSLYVTYLSNFESLRRTQQTYYQQQRFADVFVSATRVPRSLAAALRELPGVSAIEARVVAEVELDVPDFDQPVIARVVSLPAGRRPLVNDLYLRRGNWIDPDRTDDVLVAEAFAEAHDLRPGDTLTALINGRSRRLHVAGVALSAEYIYTTARGEIIPDDKRFGVLWMNERSLAAAVDMEGAFNDVVIAVGAGASIPAVIAEVDALLERYGGRGAIPRALQFSHWTLESELSQLESFGVLLPLIFLLVAAFVLNVALSRALTLQRPQLAALKALGYTNGELAWHYTKWALVVGSSGLVLGLGIGAWLGSIVADLYNQYFKFPDLAFSVPPRTMIGATALTLASAGGGAYAAVRRAVRIPPAEAMRPEAPARYRKTMFETPMIARELGAVGRMVIRNVARHPLRAAISVCGIAAAVGLLMVGLVMVDAMNHLIDTQFWEMQRQDATVGFVEPRSSGVRHELARLPGVLAVEPVRSVAVRVRAGHRHRYVSLTGIHSANLLQRIVDYRGRVFEPPSSGVTLSTALAEALQVRAGDDIAVEVLEGDRRTHVLPVRSLVDDLLGLTAYMELDALHKLMREGGTATGALLLVDRREEPSLLARLKAMPGVAGVSLKRPVLEAFRDTMAATLDLTIFINLLFASVIAMGVVYNAARVALSERSHELASLRVLGYTRAEISMILLSELALLTAAALPIGWAFGYGLCAAVFSSVQTEVYRFPLHVSRSAAAWASIGIVGAAMLAGLIVRQRLDRLDLIAVLKVRE